MVTRRVAFGRACSCTAVLPRVQCRPDKATARLKAAPETRAQASSYADSLPADDGRRRVQLGAQQSGELAVRELPNQSPLAEYMSLPASQYSVLDGSKVERLDEETFRVFVAPFRFFSFEVQPILTLQVQAKEAGCVITMHSCHLRGSSLLEAQNDNFAARMTNDVQWRHSDDPEKSKVASDTRVDVDLIIPRWFVMPRGVVRSTGNKVIESILKRAVPQFLQQLERDYRAWAAGDPDRQPLDSTDLC